jgi:hypothetical protein
MAGGGRVHATGLDDPSKKQVSKIYHVSNFLQKYTLATS